MTFHLKEVASHLKDLLTGCLAAASADGNLTDTGAHAAAVDWTVLLLLCVVWIWSVKRKTQRLS